MKIDRIHFRTVGSTNSWAKDHAHEFSREGITIVTAEEQTAGKGRFRHKWLSPKGNLYATFCFFLPDLSQISCITPLMALSAMQTLEDRSFQPQLKWPNDLLLNEKKVAGILGETVFIDSLWCVIIGIGINIKMSYEVLNQIPIPATTLELEEGISSTVEDILTQLQQRFLSNFQNLTTTMIEYRRRLAYMLGKRIRFHEQGTLVEGCCHSIQENGALQLLLDTGELRTFINPIHLPRIDHLAHVQ